MNDRPYAASSVLSVALNRLFRTAMAGNSRERPELAAAAIPLEVAVEPLPVPGDGDLARRLFAPPGWQVDAARVPNGDGRNGDGRPSRYIRLGLRGTLRLADALGHLYVLIPVLDADKHYWVGEDEVKKLLARGAQWLPSHPERELIALVLRALHLDGHEVAGNEHHLLGLGMPTGFVGDTRSKGQD